MRLKNVKGANEIIIKGTYYVDNPYQYKGKWNKFFGNNNPIYIEIGMGKGDFIIENAKRYKDINFIGIEKFDSVIVRAIQKSNELELDNLKIIRVDANKLGDIFDKEIDTIYLNFSDPWPKDRHAKRRLTSPIFLDIYSKIFEGRNRIVQKTDNINLFDYSLESLIDYGYDIVYKTNDLDCLNEENIMTEYEKRFYSLGVKINKLEAIRQKRNKC
jgi:tRNA (guanine-N7-)-methyltransferase